MYQKTAGNDVLWNISKHRSSSKSIHHFTGFSFQESLIVRIMMIILGCFNICTIASMSPCNIRDLMLWPSPAISPDWAGLPDEPELPHADIRLVTLAATHWA